MEQPYSHVMVKLGRLQTMPRWISNTSTEFVQPPATTRHDPTLATAWKSRGLERLRCGSIFHEEFGNVQLTLLLPFVWSLSCGCCLNKRDSTEVDCLPFTHPATTKMRLSIKPAPKVDRVEFMLGAATIVGSPLLLLLLLWGGPVSIISTDDKSWHMRLRPPKMTM